MLSELHLRDVGPVTPLDVEFTERLNIFTGDNGLGKTFLLDCAWWALTGMWREEPSPQRGENKQAHVGAVFSGSHWSTDVPAFSAGFSRGSQMWYSSMTGHLTRSLVVYAGVDGRFSVFDPIRNHNPTPAELETLRVATKGSVTYKDRASPSVYHFSQSTLWNGLKQGETVYCNGLIQDWAHWQLLSLQPGTSSPFAILGQVLKILSHPDEPMAPGYLTRALLDDARDIPTIRLPYGEVPITQLSAGIKRVVNLAYLLVWAWVEHTLASNLFGIPPADRLVLLIDEVELHLHPKWQRSILPALMKVAEALSGQIATQTICTTHSPLVLASMEPEFDEERDRLFLFDTEGGQVKLDELPWCKQGDASNWLTSPIFGLSQARSIEAERAIIAANALMRGDLAELPEGLKTKEEIHEELCRVLPSHDRFWPRWIVQDPEDNDDQVGTTAGAAKVR